MHAKFTLFLADCVSSMPKGLVNSFSALFGESHFFVELTRFLRFFFVWKNHNFFRFFSKNTPYAHLLASENPTQMALKSR